MNDNRTEMRTRRSSRLMVIEADSSPTIVQRVLGERTESVVVADIEPLIAIGGPSSIAASSRSAEPRRAPPAPQPHRQSWGGNPHSSTGTAGNGRSRQ